MTDDCAAAGIEELLQQSLRCIDARRYEEALTCGQRILAAKPQDVAGTHIVGLSHLRLGEAQKALPLLEQTLQAKPGNGLVHWQVAQALAGTGRHEEAIVHFDRAEHLGVDDPQLVQQRYDAAGLAFQHDGNWLQYDRVQRLVRQSVVASGRWIVGESTLASPYFGNALQLRATRNHARQVMAGLGDVQPFAPAEPGERIRLGFVGCDFFEQATAYLTVGFIEAIDRKRFEVSAYDHGGDRADTEFRRRVVEAYDRFVPIRDLSDAEAAERIHGDRIDVLFSIKNPASARLGVFARRPSPVQIHYLYYPGTSGMPFFDYIVADEVVIPPGMEAAYTEAVLRLPGCYQPNDGRRVTAVDTPRSRWGLPASAVVLANFSQVYKYTPDMFDLWCQILHRDDRRILWLLCEDADLQLRLRREARNRGIAPERLFFTAKLTTQPHLDRLRHADLVVDTFPYGGHTLTSDALWAGTPVVTLRGETFASRVAASLLTDVGLAELVADNELDYVDKADRLLRDPDRLRHWRQHLDEGRSRFPLFDTDAYARKFETMVANVVAERWSRA